MMIDRLRQMAIFAKTIDHGSFRGAAQELKLSPSVVSHHVSQLEEHLGVALIYRSTRKLALTSDGERLLEATRKMLDAVEGELEGLSETAGTPAGTLRLALPMMLSQSKLTKKLAAFSVAFPRVELSLDFSDTRRELVADGFDLAIRVGTRPKNTPTSRQLFVIQRKMVASKSYLAAHPKAVTLEEFQSLDWILMPQVHSGSVALTNSDGRKVTIKPNSHISSNNAFSLYRLALEGAGITIVPEILAERDLAKGEVVEVLADWKLQPIEVFAEWHSNTPKKGLVHQVLDALS